MLGRLGWPEILVIVVLLIVLFGSSKIPSMMKNLAGGIKTFKKEMKDDDTKKVEPKKESVKKSPAKKATAKVRGRSARKTAKK